FDVFGQPVHLGRLFTARDFVDAPLTGTGLTRPGVVILSHDLWQREFGGRRDVIGRTIQLEAQPLEIVGVLSKTSDDADYALGAADCWTPVRANPQSRRARYLMVIGRRTAAATLKAVEADINTVAARLANAYPDADKGWTVRAVPLLETVGESVTK